MKIGQDVDMSTNVSEGYMIMEFKKRELYIQKEFQPDAFCRFYCHAPDYYLEEIYGTSKPVGISTIMEDEDHSAETLWEIYNKHKDGIDSMICDNLRFPTSEYDMLRLAGEISAYCGLN